MNLFSVAKPKILSELTLSLSFDEKPEYDEALFKVIEAESADLAKISIQDSVLQKCNLSAAKVTESLWRRIVISDCRMSGVIWYDAIVRDVELTNCKLDLANFRATKFKNVIFKDCVLTGADLQGCELTNVIFDSCDINDMDVNACTMKNVDLRSSTFTVVKGTNALKGTTMSRQQLIMLAPIFANEIGIKIED